MLRAGGRHRPVLVKVLHYFRIETNDIYLIITYIFKNNINLNKSDMNFEDPGS